MNGWITQEPDFLLKVRKTKDRLSIIVNSVAVRVIHHSTCRSAACSPSRAAVYLQWRWSGV